MPLDFSKYVFRGRPLQTFDIGQGFRDVIEARFGRERIDNQKAQHAEQMGEQRAGRSDLNTRWASQVAEGRADLQHKEHATKQDELNKLKQKARELIAAGDRNGARALFGRIAELGGTVNEQPGPGGFPIFDIQGGESSLPERSTDTQQVRGEIFGGAPAAGRMGPSFSAPSPFNAGGRPGPVQNPFDRGVPTSAASLPQPAPQAAPQQPPAAPPAPPAPTRPGEAAAAASADAQAAISGLEASVNGSAPPAPGISNPESDGGMRARLLAAANRPEVASILQQHGVPVPQPEPRNPFNPYRLDTGQITAENNARMDPYLLGIERAAPAGFRPGLQEFHKGIKSLGYGPEDTVKLTHPDFSTLAGMYNSGVSADAARSRAAISGENAELGRNIRLENRIFSRADKIVQNTGLRSAIEKLQVARGADGYLNAAKSGNGQATTQLVAQLYRMNQAGVMTDKDFEHASSGAVTVWTAIKEGMFENFIQDGISLDKAAAIKEVLNVASKTHRQSIADAQRQLWTQVQRAGSEEERKAAEDAIMQLIPQEYWMPEVQQAFGMDVPQKSGNMDQSGNYATTPAPRGAQPQGKVSVSASSSSSSKKSDGLEDYK